MADTKLQQAMKEQIQRKRDEERQIQALAKQGEKEALQPEIEEKWKAVDKAATELLEKGYQGYDNFVSAYSQILGLCAKLFEAIAASNPVGTIADTAFDKLILPKIHNIEDSLRNKYKNLPTLEVKGVEYTDDNKLDLSALSVSASDGSVLPKETDDFFKQGVKSWLLKNGYSQSAQDNNVFKNSNGAELTKDKFEELLADPEKGLGKYLGDDFQVKVDYQAPRPGL